MSHKFELSSAISNSIIYTNDDNIKFKFLYRKFCDNIGIKEKWNFGLFFYPEGADAFCINLEENYSNTKYLHKPPTVTIRLTLGIVTYPLSLTKEIWLSASVHLFFIDIHNREKKSNFNALRTIKTDAIESLLLERQSDIKFPITKREIKEENEQRLKAIKDKFNILSEWELQRKYFKILDKANFEIVTVETVCDKNNSTISMTAKNLILKENNCTSTYPWNEIKYKIKGKVCTISSLSNDKACKKDKKKLEFNSENLAKHFHYLTEVHKNQYITSYEASYDSEFEIIKDYARSEQMWIENTRSLKFKLSDSEKENSILKDSNVKLETSLSDLQNLLKKDVKEMIDLCRQQRKDSEAISDYKSLLKDIKNLEKAYEEILKEKNEKSQELKNIYKENENLKIKVHGLEVTIQMNRDHRLELQSMRDKLDKLNNSTMEGKESRLKKQINSLKSEKDHLKIEKNELSKKYHSLTSTVFNNLKWTEEAGDLYCSIPKPDGDRDISEISRSESVVAFPEDPSACGGSSIQVADSVESLKPNVPENIRVGSFSETPKNQFDGQFKEIFNLLQKMKNKGRVATKESQKPSN